MHVVDGVARGLGPHGVGRPRAIHIEVQGHVGADVIPPLAVGFLSIIRHMWLTNLISHGVDAAGSSLHLLEKLGRIVIQMI